MNSKEKVLLFFSYQSGQATLVNQETWEAEWLNWYKSMGSQLQDQRSYQSAPSNSSRK